MYCKAITVNKHHSDQPGVHLYAFMVMKFAAVYEPTLSRRASRSAAHITFTPLSNIPIYASKHVVLKHTLHNAFLVLLLACRAHTVTI